MRYFDCRTGIGHWYRNLGNQSGVFWRSNKYAAINDGVKHTFAFQAINLIRFSLSLHSSGGIMPSAIFHFATIEVDLNTGPDIRDITDQVNRTIGRSGIENGQASACVVGSTGSLSTIEYEPGVIQDLKDAINRMASPELAYAHELAWHDGNGHSHVQAALLGPSIALPIRRGRLRLGTWQQVVVINHDNRSRRRTVELTLVGV